MAIHSVPRIWTDGEISRVVLDSLEIDRGLYALLVC